MRQEALELFGLCLGFVGTLPKIQSGREPSDTQVLSLEPGSDHRTATQSFVQIGVIAIDYCPNRPARIIASVG